MTWEVASTETGGDALAKYLEHGWEPFAVTRTTMWLRREQRRSTVTPQDPTSTCGDCGEKLGHGHTDDCPRMPATLPPLELPVPDPVAA